jgi:carbamoyltransferase
MENNSEMQTNIAFYGSHNSSYVVERGGKILLVLEVERFLNYKNSGMAQYQCPKYQDILFLSQYIPEFIMKKLGISEFDNCYYINCDVIIEQRYELQTYIKAKNYHHGLHHKSHVAGAFYQSPYQEALAFSFDGGGNDGFFNIYHCVRGESPKLLDSILNPYKNNPHIYYDLGFAYMLFGEYLGDIKKEPLNIGNLVYSGKIMGLASYGNVIEDWVPHFIHFYKSGPDGNHYGPWDETGYYDYENKINELGENIGVTFDINNRLRDQIAYDVAATSQRAFEECFLEIAKPYFEEYPDLPVCMSGGCALNILLNTRLVEEFNKEVFVGPNPNDCGIALGLMLNELKPEQPFDATYSGIELLDIDSLGHYIQNSHSTTTTYFDMLKMVDDLIEGKIIGVARGRAEHGPRALGNRSILCNPSIENMKDILNEKVKHREWYRPFAPVVRLEDVSKYFEWEKESKWMSFCPKVKQEWREKLTAITHVDGTARVQTVTKEDNEWLYNLLTEMDRKTGVGVLLNTSFNVDGSPILSTIKDAFKILESTQMDGLLLEEYYIMKQK